MPKLCVICGINSSEFREIGKRYATHCKKCVEGCSSSHLNSSNVPTLTHDLPSPSPSLPLPSSLSSPFPNSSVSLPTSDLAHTFNHPHPSLSTSISTSTSTSNSDPQTDYKTVSHTFFEYVAKKCVICMKKVPKFRIKGTIKRTHCKTCIPSNRQNDFENCFSKCVVCKQKNAHFRLKGTIQRTHCKTCIPKDVAMNFEYHNHCSICKKVRASFRLIGTLTPTHCKSCIPFDNKHKFEDIKKKCINCNTTNVNQGLVSPYNKFCTACYVNKFPERAKTRKYLKKQAIFVGEIEQWLKYNEREWNHLKMSVRYDESVIAFNQCKIKRKPDILIDLQTHIIIIECDENQHSNYDNSCERARNQEIVEAFGFEVPLIMLRFNPDSYEDNKSCKHASCFTYYDAEKDTYQVDLNEWNFRMNVLLSKLYYYMFTIPTCLFTEEKLFYNNYTFIPPSSSVSSVSTPPSSCPSFVASLSFLSVLLGKRKRDEGSVS